MRRLLDSAPLREFLLPFAALGALLLFLILISPPAPAEEDAFSLSQPKPLQDIQLLIPKKYMQKLSTQRAEALRVGILMESADPWVPGTLRQGQRSWPLQLRLKGDWTDHLKGNKWSFRLQLDDGQAYRGMNTFSLQHPATREFLNEWLFHKVLRKLDVLSPRYEFARVRLNGNLLGIYALEEHFTKEMLADQHRKEGLLMKFAEEGLWEARVLALADTSFPYMQKPLFEASHAEPFQSKRLERDPVLATQHREAQTLMHQYKNGLRAPADIFDLDAVARQYALTDLFGGHHSLIWHNRRFYYDPVVQRLEPVVFDAFAGREGRYLNGPFTGYAANGWTRYGLAEDILGTIFFRDTAFVAAYYRYLWQFSEPAWVQGILEEFAAELEVHEAFIRREFIFYRYDRGSLPRNAQRIRDALTDFRPEYLRWDSVATEAGTWRYCVENYHGLALRVGGVQLQAFDGMNPADWADFEGNARPACRVLGAETR